MEEKEWEKTTFLGKLNLEDFLLCTPYEKRNNRDLESIYPSFLTEELFIKKLYSPPIERDSYSQKENLQDDTYLIPITIMSSDNSSVPMFEASLKADTPEPLFVRGYSGTGKTTFIRTLLYKIKNNTNDRDYMSIYFNIQESFNNVKLFKMDWCNESYDDRNIYKLYSLLISQIDFLLNKGEDEDQKDYKNKLMTVYENYITCIDRRFPDQRIDAIFSVIKAFINDEVPYINRYDDSFCMRMHTKILDLIDYNENQIRSTMNNLIMLIGIFLYCGSTEKTKYFILYDNIEHYIGANVLYGNL